jgi:hypothetical protein
LTANYSVLQSPASHSNVLHIESLEIVRRHTLEHRETFADLYSFFERKLNSHQQCRRQSSVSPVDPVQRARPSIRFVNGAKEDRYSQINPLREVALDVFAKGEAFAYSMNL